MKNIKPKEIVYRNYKKNFDINTFKNILRLKLQNYQPFEQVFLESLNEYAPLKKKFLRGNHVPHRRSHYVKLLSGELNLKVSILKISPLKIKLNIRNKRIITKDFIKRTENFLR